MPNILYNPHVTPMLAFPRDNRRTGVDTDQGSLQ